jgi:hypothetical protein
VTARILGFYNQSLLSSRSLVRIQQGASKKTKLGQGFWPSP